MTDFKRLQVLALAWLYAVDLSISALSRRCNCLSCDLWLSPLESIPQKRCRAVYPAKIVRFGFGEMLEDCQARCRDPILSSQQKICGDDNLEPATRSKKRRGHACELCIYCRPVNF